MEYRVDILIVGAGIAGLRCGIELLNQNPKKTVLILEKYNYSGGRVVTYSTDIDSKKYQWENGAGRISDTHLKVHDLLNKYGLETIPLSKTQLWIPTYDVKPEENPFDATMEVMLPIFQKLQPKALATHTLMELSVKLLGPYKAKELFEPFPYRAEVNTLRADLAIESFSNEMGPGEEFSVVKTGLSSLIDKMVEDFKKKGGKLFMKQDVQDVQQDGDLVHVITRTPHGKVVWKAPITILALHVDALRGLPSFKEAPVTKLLKMEPLLRCYAVFDTPCLKGIERFVTPTPLRYFIPISDTVAMISYTESGDATRLMEMSDGVLKHYLVNQLRDLLPERDIPDPIFFKKHPWTSGCTYWLPGSYDVEEESKKAHHPFPDTMPGVYCCGESYSLRQAWMEGALESADFLLEERLNF